MTAMRKYLLVLSMTACSMVHASDWTRIKYDIYPQMNEYLATLRTYANTSEFPISVIQENWEYGIRSYCSGSSSTAPPWSSYFSALFDDLPLYSGWTGGTVSARKMRIWDLYCLNNGGEEGWFKANENPTSHFRMRIDRDSVWIDTYEVNLTGQGGNGQ